MLTYNQTDGQENHLLQALDSIIVRGAAYNLLAPGV